MDGRTIPTNDDTAQHRLRRRNPQEIRPVVQAHEPLFDEGGIHNHGTAYMQAQRRRPQRRRRQQTQRQDDSDQNFSHKRTSNGSPRPRPSRRPRPSPSPTVSSGYADTSQFRSASGQGSISYSPEGEGLPSQSREPGPRRSHEATSSRRTASRHRQAQPSQNPQKISAPHEEAREEPPKRLTRRPSGNIVVSRMPSSSARGRTQRRRGQPTVRRQARGRGRGRGRGAIGKVNGKDIQPDMLPKLPDTTKRISKG